MVTISSVRLRREDYLLIRMLVELGVFESVSEATSYFLSKGIEAVKDKIAEIDEALSEIQQLRKELKDIFK